MDEAEDYMDAPEHVRDEPMPVHAETTHTGAEVRRGIVFASVVTPLALGIVLGVFILIACHGGCRRDRITYAAAVAFPLALILGGVAALICTKMRVAHAYGLASIVCLFILALVFISLSVDR